MADRGPGVVRALLLPGGRTEPVWLAYLETRTEPGAEVRGQSKAGRPWVCLASTLLASRYPCTYIFSEPVPDTLKEIVFLRPDTVTSSRAVTEKLGDL